MTGALQWLATVDWAGPWPRVALLVVLGVVAVALAWTLIQMDRAVQLPRQPWQGD